MLLMVAANTGPLHFLGPRIVLSFEIPNLSDLVVGAMYQHCTLSSKEGHFHEFQDCGIASH